MKKLDEFALQEALDIFFEKQRLLETGEMVKLIELKKKCPDIFDKEIEAQVCELIDYAKLFQASDRYKELKRTEIKKKFRLIQNEEEA